MSGLEEGLVNKGINAKFSIGLPDFVTSTKEIKDKISGSKEQVVTDSNGNTYKVKTDIDELDSKVLEASKNKGNNSSNTGNISNNKGVGRVDTLGEKLTLAPNDGKHKGVAKGKISADPFWNDFEAGEKSLNTSYYSSSDKQLYNIHNGELVKFRADNSGGWHPYKVINTSTEIPNSVLKQMYEDGLINKTEYNKFIKNK